MSIKIEEKKKAIELRRKGKTYSEILSEVEVAKSTLAIWFQEAGIGEKQKQPITEARVKAQRRGAESRRSRRILNTEFITSQAVKDIESLSNRELWLIGTVLYWAEGTKQKEWNVSQSLQFNNSDPLMIKLYLLWLRKVLKVSNKEIIASLFIHKSSEYRLQTVVSQWKGVTGLKVPFSDRVYFKHHNPSDYRYNLGENYFGTVRITVRKSTNLNRKVAGWVSGICKYWGIV